MQKTVVIVVLIFLFFSLSDISIAGSETGEGDYDGGHTDPWLPWEPSGNWDQASDSTQSSSLDFYNVIYIVGIGAFIVMLFVLIVVAFKKKPKEESGRICLSCNRKIPFDSITCPYCGKTF